MSIDTFLLLFDENPGRSMDKFSLFSSKILKKMSTDVFTVADLRSLDISDADKYVYVYIL